MGIASGVNSGAIDTWDTNNMFSFKSEFFQFRIIVVQIGSLVTFKHGKWDEVDKK